MNSGDLCKLFLGFFSNPQRPVVTTPPIIEPVGTISYILAHVLLLKKLADFKTMDRVGYSLTSPTGDRR